MKKFAHFQQIEARTARLGHGLMKDAHRHAFNYEPQPGFLYVRSRAISSRCNDNFDEFPAEEIKAAYRTFIGKPVFVNHVNANHKRARGVIVDAALHEDINPDGSADTWVEVLMEVDAVRFPMLAQAIINGEADRTSMGCDVGFSVCSFCGNEARTPMEYCAHIKHHKGRRIRRRTAGSSSSYEDVLVREICHKLSFFENSILVEDPADPTAFFLGVESGDELVAAGQKTASLQQVARQSIDADEVATMVDALAGKLRDSKFGNISDLCEVSVNGTNLFCDASKNIPRSRMPQLSDDSGKDITSKWLQKLKDQGISVREETVRASTLKATQNQLNGKKVAAIADKMRSGGMPDVRICVSQDGYIVDGHHRWAAKICHDLLDGDLGDVQMPVTKIGMDIIKLLDDANAFAKENGIAQRGINAALRAMAVGPLDTPVSAYGMIYDPAVANGASVDEARRFKGWDALPSTYLPKGVKLYATEQMLSSESIKNEDEGGAIRPGYDSHILLDGDGRYVVINGHHRVAIYANAGLPMPVRIWEVAVPMSAAASVDDIAKEIFEALVPKTAGVLGTPGFLSPAEFSILQQRVQTKVNVVPQPTPQDIERNLKSMRESGRAGGDFRGNSYDRRRRSQRLLEEFGDGHTAGCAYCGKVLDASTLTEDKIITGKLGGRYILPNLIPACQPCNASRSDSPFSLAASLEKTAGHILKLKQIRKGDIIGSFGGAVVIEVEADVPLYVDGTTGIKLTFDRDLGAGRRTVTMGADETLLVENPGSRRPPAYEPPPPPKPGDRIGGHCPVCMREVTYPLGGRLPRHNMNKPGRGTASNVCDGSGKTFDEASAIRDANDREWRDRQRWSARTASYGTLWRSSTGMLHKSMMCPNLNAQSNVTPVPAEDLAEDALVQKEGKNACTLCFPSAPSRRTSVESFAVKKAAAADPTYTSQEEADRASREAESYFGYDSAPAKRAREVAQRWPNTKTALGEKKAPPDVDTLRDEACPVCGETDAFSGEDCGVCGFKKPPDAFLDPNVEKAKEVDLHMEKEKAEDDAEAVSSPSLQCDNCGATFGGAPTTPGAPPVAQPAGSGVERFKVAVLPDPARQVDAPSPSAQPESSQKAGDHCPECGEGTLHPVEGAPSAAEEVEEPEGNQTPEVNDISDDEDDDDIEDDDDDGDDDDDDPIHDVPKDQSRHKKESTMRPILRTVAEQQIMLTSAIKSIETIADAAGIDISPHRREAQTKIATLRRRADVENPANPIPEPAAEAPAVTTEEAKTPEARVDVTQQGGVPANTDVPPDATTSVTEQTTVLPVDQSPQEAQDPSKPVQGTQEPQDGKIEGEVKIGDPNDSTDMFAETGWTKESRTLASIRLARLRMQAGLEPPQDDLVLGQSIAASQTPSVEIQKEIDTLARVAAARPPAQDQRPIARSLVPRAASASDRSVPSLAPQPHDVPGGAPSMEPNHGETNGLW